jgi:hypothetical protein
MWWNLLHALAICPVAKTLSHVQVLRCSSLMWVESAFPVFSLLSMFWKNKNRFMRSPCFSVCPPYQLLRGWTSLYETCLSPSQRLASYIPPISLYPIVARQRLGKNVTAAANTRNSRIVGLIFFYVICVISKESRWLVLPRISCY